LKGLGWELPEETRLSSLMDPSIRRNHEELSYRRLFGALVNARASDYTTRYASRNVAHLPVRNEAYGFENPGGEWLALNPTVGRPCGWSPVDSDLFEWRDERDQLMAKSIWSVDGNVDHAPPHHQDQVGEGWIVIASPQGLEKLSKCLGPFDRQIEVKPTARIDDRQKETSASKRESP
jgi:hypothetical protein